MRRFAFAVIAMVFAFCFLSTTPSLAEIYKGPISTAYVVHDYGVVMKGEGEVLIGAIGCAQTYNNTIYACDDNMELVNLPLHIKTTVKLGEVRLMQLDRTSDNYQLVATAKVSNSGRLTGIKSVNLWRGRTLFVEADVLYPSKDNPGTHHLSLIGLTTIQKGKQTFFLRQGESSQKSRH